MKPFQRWVLPNGLTFLYRQSPGVPLAAATLLLRSGSRDESPRQAGLASLTTELMMQGTRNRSARRIAEEIESIGASLGAQASEDYSELGFAAPVAQMSRVLEVMVDVITRPSFPKEEIAKERKSVLASLKSRQDSIFNFAYDAFNKTFYGSHPYGRPIDGTEETVQRFTRDDFKAWHREHVRPDRAIFSMISSLSPRDVKAKITQQLRTWKKEAPFSSPAQPSMTPPARNTSQRLTSRFEQAYFMTGVLAPAAQEPETMTLKVLNTLLGGGMSSRLFMRLREELGLAYEVSSFFPTRLASSQWVIYLGLPAAKLSLAKKELEKILAVLQREGPSRGDVDQAIAMIKGSFLMEHQTRRRQAWYAAWWEFLGRRQDYDRDFLKAVERVTPGQVRTLARRLLAQPRVTVEVVPKSSGKGKR